MLRIGAVEAVVVVGQTLAVPLLDETLSPMSSSALSLFAASTNGPVMSIPLTLHPKRCAK